MATQKGESRVGADSDRPVDEDNLVDTERRSYSDEAESTPQPEPKQADLPDGGYGWVCVACVFLINAHTWGVNSVSGRKSHNMVISRTHPHYSLTAYFLPTT